LKRPRALHPFILWYGIPLISSFHCERR